MQSLIHSLNIGTLATWLSVAGFGTVGVIVPEWKSAPAVPVAAETTVLDEDFTLGDSVSANDVGGVKSVPMEQVEPLPAPPEAPAVTDFTPLPEVPELPAPSEAPVSVEQAKPASVIRESTGARAPKSAVRRSGQGTAASQGPSGGSSSSSGMSSASRLAAGSMPAPSYPAESRRKGQTGTVVVEFTVDSSGRVISATAKSPSPWPLLNNEAVRTVRRWKFPPGGVMKLQRPIVFQLR